MIYLETHIKDHHFKAVQLLLLIIDNCILSTTLLSVWH